ncbi:Uncharacterized protein DBV15_04448 [Temnothorax longispinosus]|uniref:Uncharacterized protein n=1 Tax=Temnothorax longispinosus TaxID=300112 RepID=A0A4S2KD99_9HYME|nr:Uncharacterized protein DBV15_04448 [Temnothorax longispinosus]
MTTSRDKVVNMIFRDRDPSDKDRAKHASRASGSRLPSVFGSPVGYLEISIKSLLGVHQDSSV